MLRAPLASPPPLIARKENEINVSQQKGSKNIVYTPAFLRVITSPGVQGAGRGPMGGQGSVTAACDWRRVSQCHQLSPGRGPMSGEDCVSVTRPGPMAGTLETGTRRYHLHPHRTGSPTTTSVLPSRGLKWLGELFKMTHETCETVTLIAN